MAVVLDSLATNLGSVTVLAAIVGLVGGLVGAGAKFLLDFLLAEKFKREWQTIEIKRKYSAPIVRAADDLAARIENIHHQFAKRTGANWLRPLTEEDVKALPFDRYFYISTLYLFAQLICWIEILKREQTYLDFTSTKETRIFNAHLNLLYAALSSPGFTGSHSDRTSKDHWIFFHYLSGIGEAMAKKNDGGGLTCLTFGDFSARYKEVRASDQKRWFEEIERLFLDLSDVTDDPRWRRIQILWFCLDRFLDLVDPDKIRTTRDRTLSSTIKEGLRKIATDRAQVLGITLR
jgi:hypothetical protein